MQALKGVTTITHGDVDGVVCLALLLKYLGSAECRIYFTSPTKLQSTLHASILKGKSLERLYAFDLTPDEQLAALSSTYKRATWIDHHVWESFEPPENVELIIDPESPSAAQLVANYFKIYSKLTDWANEVDRNRVVSKEAEFLRDLVGALKKGCTSAAELNQVLRQLAEELAFFGFEAVKEREEYGQRVEAYRQWIEAISRQTLATLKVYEVVGLKVGVCEACEFVPIYALCNALETKLDVFVLLTHQAKGTRVDLRSFKGIDLIGVARQLGGGGHRVACSATLNQRLEVEQLLHLLKVQLNKLEPKSVSVL